MVRNDKVDLILDVPNSAIALAVQDLTRQMKRVVIFTSAGSADLTRPARPMACTGPTTPMPYATGVASGVMDDGGKSWFFITSDYAFGHSLERDAMAVVKSKRPGAGQRAPSHRQCRLLVLPVAGAGVQAR